MLNPTELLADALGNHLAAAYERAFSGGQPRYTEPIAEAARLILERIGSSDALYHSTGHSALVTLVGKTAFGKITNMRLLIFGVLIAIGLSACSREVPPVGQAEYAEKIVGDWQGRVGGDRERILFRADGTFVSQVRPSGFISNTLGQGVTGMIRGTWAIKGSSITLNISSAEDERVVNKTTTSTIEAFKPNEILVISSTGEISTFVRL